MINHDFDPYEFLELLRTNQHKLNHDIQEIVKGFNHRGELIETMIKQINAQADAIHQLDQALGILNNKLTILEHEQNKSRDT